MGLIPVKLEKENAKRAQNLPVRQDSMKSISLLKSRAGQVKKT